LRRRLEKGVEFVNVGDVSRRGPIKGRCSKRGGDNTLYSRLTARSD
jgi:hypothetical protein